MQCTRTWHRCLVAVATAFVCGAWTAPSWGEGYGAANGRLDGGSVTLDGRDSSGGSPSRGGRTVQQRAPQPRSTITLQPSRPATPRTTAPPRRTTPPATTRLRSPVRQPQRRTVTRNRARTPRRNSNAVRNNRNWGLGGDRWRRPATNGNPAAGIANARRAVQRIDNELIRVLEQRELARNKYEYGGGFRRDLNDFNQYQNRILRLQRQRNAIMQANLSNQQQRQQVQNNYRATRGLNAQRYRGLRDTRWPVGQRATSRWLNNPNYRQ